MSVRRAFRQLSRASSRRATIVLVAMCAVLGTTGCIHGTIPARELYRLTLPDSALPTTLADGMPASGGGSGAAGRPALDGTIAIMPYETPGLYGESTIAYRVGDEAYGTYPNREWALPLGDMLGHITSRIAADGRLTHDVPLYAPPSPRAHTYQWRAHVREFEEVDRGAQVFVSVRLDAAIVRSRDDSVVWTGTANRELPVSKGSEMASVVRALSAAAAAAIGELVTRAERDVAGASASRPPAADTARRTP